MKSLSHDELIQLYNAAESCDQELFAEQRSNLLLVAGDHYNKKGSRQWNRIRESKDLSADQKLRLTKNHVQKISKTYVNTLVSYAPSVTIRPNNEKELQDVKSAELNKAVLQHGKTKMKVVQEKTLQYAEDFVNIGELAVKMFWDPFAGDLMGYEPELDQFGQPVTDEEGNPQQTPKFSGAIVPERIFGFNLLRTPETKDMECSSPLIIRKMVSVEDLKIKCNGDAEMLKAVQESADRTFHVFDANTNTYSNKNKSETMLLEFYFPKCVSYPMGYFYYATLSGKLWEGELPFGIWPIVYTGMDSVQTSPRHRSLIKQLRPFQAEVNRTGSKIAEHQITIGDDKLLLPSGSKISNGVQLPGVRSIQYTGGKPEYLAGRSGDHYVTYMTSQIQEMYQIANVDMESAEKDLQGDLMLQLFKSIKQKKKFSIYTGKFEAFFVRYWELYLELAKNYFDDNMLIPAIGKSEFINISEFRNTDPLSSQIKVEPQTDDVESMMGKQVIFNHAIQYIGNSLDKKSIGKIMKNMPFGNFENAFSELTMDEDMATNMILAIDRGEAPMPNKYDEHLYMIKRLTERTRQADYSQLDPQIQKNYDTYIKHYEGLEEKRMVAMKQAQSEFIPSGGARVKVDFYVASPANPDRTERATLPTEAVSWLIDQLAKQGSSQEALSRVNQGAVAEMATSFNQREGAQLQSMQSPPPQMQGPASPEGYQ